MGYLRSNSRNKWKCNIGSRFYHQRAERYFANRAREMDIDPELHYLNAPKDTRKRRVNKRNFEKDPAVYAFEVTDMMFDFMEPKFEVPDQDELLNGHEINAS